jgi:hypothetical protein
MSSFTETTTFAFVQTIMADQFTFEYVDWQPVLFGNKDFLQLMKKWNLDEFVTLKR